MKVFTFIRLIRITSQRFDSIQFVGYYIITIELLADWLILCKQRYCYVFDITVTIKWFSGIGTRTAIDKYNIYMWVSFLLRYTYKFNEKHYLSSTIPAHSLILYIFSTLTLIQASKLIALTKAYHLIGRFSFSI